MGSVVDWSRRPSTLVGSVVRSQTGSADRFVRTLVASNGAPVQLDTKVLAPDKGSHVALEYDCAKRTGCSVTRLEAVDLARIDEGVWYKGCYSVTAEGYGYGADHLDLEMRRSGDSCPTG